MSASTYCWRRPYSGDETELGRNWDERRGARKPDERRLPNLSWLRQVMGSEADSVKQRSPALPQLMPLPSADPLPAANVRTRAFTRSSEVREACEEIAEKRPQHWVVQMALTLRDLIAGEVRAPITL